MSSEAETDYVEMYSDEFPVETCPTCDNLIPKGDLCCVTCMEAGTK